MLLSNIPFNCLQTTDNWITGLTGKLGKIIEIDTKKDGKFWDTWLIIEWNDGTTSHPRFPDECDNLVVAAPNAIHCRPWVNDMIERLRVHQAFYEIICKPEA